MTKSGWIAIALAVALIASNVFWTYALIDAGVSLTYMKVSADDAEEALSQTIAVLPVVARQNASRAEIIAAARQDREELDMFEKDGFVWIGRIGLRFNADDHLVEVRKGSSP